MQKSVIKYVKLCSRGMERVAWPTDALTLARPAHGLQLWAFGSV